LTRRLCPSTSFSELVYADVGRGIIGVAREGSPWITRKILKGGSRRMPFPSNIPRAADVAAEERGEPISEYEGKDLLLERYETFETDKFGGGVILYCQDENGEPVKLSTFSEVVIKQLEPLKDKLPVIITPRKVSNYYVIY